MSIIIDNDAKRATGLSSLRASSAHSAQMMM